MAPSMPCEGSTGTGSSSPASGSDLVSGVGCAGGGDATLTLALESTAPTAGNRAYRLEVCGLRGGHSGIDIHENRGNAVKLVTRMLVAALNDEIGIELVRVPNHRVKEVGGQLASEVQIGEVGNGQPVQLG